MALKLILLIITVEVLDEVYLLNRFQVVVVLDDRCFLFCGMITDLFNELCWAYVLLLIYALHYSTIIGYEFEYNILSRLNMEATPFRNSHLSHCQTIMVKRPKVKYINWNKYYNDQVRTWDKSVRRSNMATILNNGRFSDLKLSRFCDWTKNSLRKLTIGFSFVNSW